MHEHDEHSHHSHSVPDTPEKMVALLNHLCEHNEEHTHELSHLTEALKESGKDDVASKLEEAIAAYDKGNELMHATVGML